jgi:phosphate transport system substrate-binding protein
MEEFVAEYTSNEAMGEGGYLTDRGLVVLSEKKLEEMQTRAKEGKKMEAPAS